MRPNTEALSTLRDRTEGDLMPLNENRPQRPTGLPRRLHISRRLAASGVAGALGVAAIVAVATQTSVLHAEPSRQTPDAPVPTIAAESTDEDAPEQASPASPVPAPEVAANVYDQPTVDEVAYVRYLVGQHSSQPQTRSVDGGEGAQYLSADLTDPSADGQRRYTLFYFDYASNELLHYVVNVGAGTVESVTAGSGVQPAPTDQETRLAFELLLADPLSQGIKDEFLEATGAELTDPDQTTFSAHSFTAGPASLGAESCGVERCVQLLVETPDGRYLTTTPLIVNLSTHTVTSIK